MAKLRLGTSYWLDRYSGRRAAIRHDARPSPGGHRDRRGRHHGMRGGVPVRAGRRAGRAGRGAPHRPRQHRGEHRPADAGARRRFRATSPERYGAGDARRIWTRSRASVRGFVRLAAATCESAPGCRRRRPSTGRATGGRSSDLRRELARRHAAGIPRPVAVPGGVEAARPASTAPAGSSRAATRRSIRTARASASRRARATRARGCSNTRRSGASTGTRDGVDIELEHGDDPSRTGRSSPPGTRRRNSSRSPAGSR